LSDANPPIGLPQPAHFHFGLRVPCSWVESAPISERFAIASPPIRRERGHDRGLVLGEQSDDGLRPLRAAHDEFVAGDCNGKSGLVRTREQAQSVHVAVS